MLILTLIPMMRIQVRVPAAVAMRRRRRRKRRREEEMRQTRE